MIFGAKIWVMIMTNNKPLQPQRLEIAAGLPVMEKKYNVSERNQ